jgi:PhnB protein
MAEPSRPTGLTPYLTVKGAKAASEFYQRAFAAEELSRQAADDGDRLMHCQMRINGDDLFMSDAFPEYNGDSGENPRGVTLHLQVDDAQAWWDRAVAAGATPTMPMAVQFWGDRYGQLRDPFGHMWSIGGPANP